MTRQEAMTIAAYIGVSFPTHCTDAALAALATDLERYDVRDAQAAAKALRDGRSDLRLPAWAEVREAIDRAIERRRVSEDRWLGPGTTPKVDPEQIYAFVDELKERLRSERDTRPVFTMPPWVAARQRRLEREKRRADLAGYAMSPVDENGTIQFTDQEQRLVNERIVRSTGALARSRDDEQGAA